MPLIHTLTLPCNEKAARIFRAAFSPVMDTLLFTRSDRDKYLLTLSEVVTNLAKYPVPKPEIVRIELWRSRRHWRLRIVDNGPPFVDLLEKPQASLPQDGVMSESGRGLYILHQQFPTFRYSSSIEENINWNSLELTSTLTPNASDLPTAVIVDDDPVFLKIIEEYLRETFSSTGFSNVEAALEYLDTNPVDLVISDINMPGTDGYMFRQKLQKRGGLDTVPFIYLTGSGSNDNRDKAAELSIDGFLTKPVKKQELISTIRRIMKRASDLRSSFGDRLDNEITNALRPGFSEHPNHYVVATAHEAASAGGGDLLIEQAIDGGHLIVLADIMGHGEQAKFFAHAFSGYAYGAIRALGRSTSPGALLSELSMMFLDDRVLKHSFATALALVLEPDGSVTMASAGHPPPFIIDSTKLTTSEVGGPLLGLMDTPIYEETRVKLLGNQRLVLFTDGISEAERSVVPSPADMMGQLIDDLPELSDQRLASGLLERAQARSNYILLDDATSVVIRKSE